jgi:hypothetical protein
MSSARSAGSRTESVCAFAASASGRAAASSSTPAGVIDTRIARRSSGSGSRVTIPRSASRWSSAPMFAGSMKIDRPRLFCVHEPLSCRRTSTENSSGLRSKREIRAVRLATACW